VSNKSISVERLKRRTFAESVLGLPSLSELSDNIITLYLCDSQRKTPLLTLPSPLNRAILGRALTCDNTIKKGSLTTNFTNMFTIYVLYAFIYLHERKIFCDFIFIVIANLAIRFRQLERQTRYVGGT
jgi:hypothetical protein